MILTCPDCATRYFVKDGAIGPEGRQVRCTSCGTTWRAGADMPLDLVNAGDEGALAVEAAAPPPQQPEVLAELAAPELPKAFRARAEQRRKLKQAAVQGGVWAVIGVGFTSLFASAYLFRAEIVELYPRAAGAYAMVGARVNPVGLEFEALKAEPAAGAPGMVRVSGAVRNVRDRALEAPMIRVSLIDAHGDRVALGRVQPPPPAIAPGQSRTFSILLADPERKAADVDLAFDLDAPRHASRAHQPQADGTQGHAAEPDAAVGHADAATELGHGLRPALDAEPPVQPAEALPESDHHG
ncbi:DUF3426 domain-containing protein [Brevundimonas sp. 2R-24]|uniref:DUF3426 domain-containing protein n=1 Tax=Peiella sedimenti TaxID=3061083 RepID=A0ABT8SH63_9CAUL|nr:DUF3426 domain-containing protein [Caulobacteraceae bacterium XZ-24]